ncbi:tRNA epoxyqueuosine(34) reductase QueG [Salinivibrio sp. VYel9]|nr:MULTISPECIES: tRNA epoxyqueuosine(34) reductase QueG [unclassified Salinivibrio]OOE66573.1 tRNA epoxyqueuosine(34) reductase QueG [Salinivibrio sp. IB868]OOE72551.1 tRNA epoxyqueuosine(34) reductase QueG [Salinivibrio sp. IB870]OOE75615.1 tRNA epoxyqueuosine(34) reductase QueG [Salinivibrio sp. ML290]OOE82691.1 tRNA epoxyqueuosine(34) reductase QueG [Salinivibrio sp. PR6]MPS32878.1 tRNA epoxyqueuosine(34) reductase QueG [Salinivibrio sp. VYel7]
MSQPKPDASIDFDQLAQRIKQWGQALGFQQVGITDVDLKQHEAQLQRWLDNGYHGEMAWMARHGMMRARPDELVPGTVRVISVRMNYLPPNAGFAQTLANPDLGYVSRYSLGRDYHKLIRNRLKKLGQQIEAEVGPYGYRPFVDSAPVLERPLAEKAGLGWTGKHSLILNDETGSWFFLGELLVDLPLPVDTPVENQCGKCVACMTSCPTQAIVAEGVVDARRCISYLTIEYDGVIPLEFRHAIGNRIYGCDDCQLVCPFNREAEITLEADFHCRPSLEQQPLTTLFNWDEETFLSLTQGSAIRRIGIQKWRRNLAIAMGNAPFNQAIIDSLKARLGEDKLVDEHIHWALSEQEKKRQRIDVKPLPTGTRRLVRIIEKGLPRDA